MATYTVGTTADTVDPNDGLSLREALALADTDPATADTIDFAPSVQGGRIVLAGSQLTVNSDVTIDGGSGVTIDADERSRVLLLQGDGTDVALQHLTITGGRTAGDFDQGGGIRAEGYFAYLALDHSAVSGNSTAGAYASGGGIFGGFVTTVTLTNSTVSGNSTAGTSAPGGGFAGSILYLTNSTVSGNSTAGAYAPGGGTSSGFSYLTNSTVSGNSTTGAYARGGGIAGDLLHLTNSTVSGNSTAGASAPGGGVSVGSYAAVRNSIVAGNTATATTEPDVAGGVRVSRLNIFGSDVDGNTPSDRENVPASLLFAGGLADNGGPTQTIALRDAADNPALGRADPAIAPATDQRGVARPAPEGTNPDIGAFELEQSDPQPPPVATTFVVTTTSDVSADDGVLTLREALALADAEVLTADRIEFASAVQGRTIKLAGSQLTINSDVTIDGGSGVTIDAHQMSRVLLVQGDGTDVTLAHLTVTGGRTTGDFDQGGGIRADYQTTLALDQVTVSRNSTVGARAEGGGIFGNYVTLTDSTVSGNSTTGAYAEGGGIRAFRSLTLTNSTVSGNRTTGDDAEGGGILGGDVELTNSTVSGNRTTGYLAAGGGIFGSDVTLTNSTVSGNRTTGDGADGGGIAGFSATLTNSTVSSNRTTGDGADGGGIRAFYSATLTNSTVSGNSTTGTSAQGGGIAGYSATLTNSTVSGNSTTGTSAIGGGVWVYSSANVRNSIIAGNTATGNTDPDVVGGIATSNGRNIFGSDVDGNAPGDRENVPASLLFAGGLADNGGPTRTIALRDAADNPALAGADPADAPATDQRGEVRPQPAGTNPDIGAFELNQAAVALSQAVGTDRSDFLSAVPSLFRHVADAPAIGPDHDVILDFPRAQHDRIDMRPIDARPGAEGNQKFSFIGDDAFTHAGQLRVEATADGDFLVSGNTDRDLDAELAFIVRTGAPQLEASDFLL